MKIFLLDAAGPLLLLIPLLFFMIVCILFEAITMVILKFNRFAKSFGDAAIVNIASLLLGFVLMFVFNKVQPGDIPLPAVLLFFYAVTVICEALFLKLLNREKPWNKIWLVSTVMNIITYLVLYVFLLWA